MIQFSMAHDIAQQSFWDKIPFLKPYALLARWDRPIGFWLTYWPAVWGLTLAPGFRALSNIDQLYYLAVFLIGAIAMRGAGCVMNDIADRTFDAQVERTKQRPLANGTVSVRAAIVLLILQLAVGAWILFSLPILAIIIGVATLPLIALYPFMKRITWWPQAFLGIVFNTGALIGWATIEHSLSATAWLLYAAAFFWTMAYDTVYAHMDSEDDMQIGIKSTALRWGPDSKKYVGVFWILSAVSFGLALNTADTPALSYVMLVVAFGICLTAHSFWNPDNRNFSLGFFRLQAKIGFLLALSTLAPVLF